MKSLSLFVCFLVITTSLADDEEIEKQATIKLLKAICDGHKGLNELFKKTYDCDDEESKNITSICFKKVIGSEKPESSADFMSMLCNSSDVGKTVEVLHSCEKNMELEMNINSTEKSAKVDQCVYGDMIMFKDIQMMFFAYCLNVSEPLNEALTKSFECEKSSASSTMLFDVKACFKTSYGKDLPATWAEERGMMCEDMDATMKHKMCQMILFLDPSRKLAIDERQKVMGECMKSA